MSRAPLRPPGRVPRMAGSTPAAPQPVRFRGLWQVLLGGGDPSVGFRGLGGGGRGVGVGGRSVSLAL